MNATTKLKRHILQMAANSDPDECNPGPLDTESQVEAAWDEYEDNDFVRECQDEVRCEGETTGLPSDYSRHYEGDAVAMEMCDGTWVGWTYWHGGGKYGEPEAIDWMEDAYDVNCESAEQLVVVRTFTRKDVPNE